MNQDCPKCRRKKVIITLGCILKTCPVCDGIGYIASPPVEVESVIEDSFLRGFAEECSEPLIKQEKEDDDFKKTRGRPKKVKNGSEKS